MFSSLHQKARSRLRMLEIKIPLEKNSKNKPKLKRNTRSYVTKKSYQESASVGNTYFVREKNENNLNKQTVSDLEKYNEAKRKSIKKLKSSNEELISTLHRHRDHK